MVNFGVYFNTIKKGGEILEASPTKITNYRKAFDMLEEWPLDHRVLLLWTLP